MELVKMQLLKRHMHNGVDLQPVDADGKPTEISVPVYKVNWLVSQGIAKKAGGPTSAPRSKDD